MTIFAFYFGSGLLREAGWPRKLGVLKGVGYDARMVDIACAQSIDWGASLGAGVPDTALQMIAEMFRDRDWEGDDAPDVKVYVEGRRDEARWGPWATAISPQAAVPSQVHFADGMTSLSIDQFLQLKRPLEPYLFNALLWGLDNPSRCQAWYASEATDYARNVPLMHKAGVDVDDEPLPFARHVDNSVEIVRDYEREFGPLPSIPSKLQADAELLGWRGSH